VTLTNADLRSASPGTFDLVTANLTGALLIEAAGRLRDLAKPGGRLILSGFLRHEEGRVMAAYSGCAVTNRAEEEEWVCVSVQRP
jgi:ribosomal protein L11 methyltransferase